jgi:hypothetical protein
VAKFKYLAMTVTDKSYFHKEINSRLNPRNACEDFLQDLSSSLFFMGVKHGLSLREEHILRVFENKVLRRIFGPKRMEVTGGKRKLHELLHNLYPSPYIFWVIKSRRVR